MIGRLKKKMKEYALIGSAILGITGLTIGTAKITSDFYQTEFLRGGYCMRQEPNSITISGSGYTIVADTNAHIKSVETYQNMGKLGIKRSVRAPTEYDTKLLKELLTSYIADKRQESRKLDNLERVVSQIR